MPTSRVEIANVALRLLGAARIASLEDRTPQALAISDLWDSTWRAELRKHAWVFAKVRVDLGASLPADPDFDYRYELPVACLRVLEVGDDRTTFEQRGRSLLTDDGPPLRLVYIAEIDEVGRWDDLFAEAVASRLAEGLAETITASSTAVQIATKRYWDSLREARRVNAIEQQSRALVERIPFLDARR